jgi:tetratricopeptide (TPR) repeat protein
MNALADTISCIRHGPDLTSVTARAIARIDAVGTLDDRVMSRVDSARAFASVNLFEEASHRLAEAFALAGDDPRLRAKALIVEIEATSRSGDFLRSLRAIEALEALGPISNARVLLAISHVRAVSGDRVAALRAIDEAQALDSPDDLTAAVEREKQRVLAYLCVRDFRAAVDASAQAVDLARATGARFAIAATLHNLGDASRRLGDLPRAYAALTESKEICEAAGHERLSILNQIYLAYLDGMSEVAGAEAVLHDLVDYVESRGFVTDALEGRFLLGALLQHRGEIVEARRELEQVLIKAREFGNRLVLEDAREALEEATEA